MKKKGPDSLEGLLIAIVACLISTLMFGTIELSGMLFVACIARYSTNRNNASFPFMLANVLQPMTGPLAGYLAQRFSVRIVVLAGSVLSFVGVAGCFFAEDILVFTILWGIVFGTGLGFATLLLPVVINDYFIEQRSKALGVCYVGSPIGFFIFPSVFEVLMEKYGLSGSFLFLAGINMHCIPLSMLLMRPKFAVKDEKSMTGCGTGCPKPEDQLDCKVSKEQVQRNLKGQHDCKVSKDQVQRNSKNQLDYKVSKDQVQRNSMDQLDCKVSKHQFQRNSNQNQNAPVDSDLHQLELVEQKSDSHSGTCPLYDKANHCHENGECPTVNAVFKHHECEQIGANFQLRVAELPKHEELSTRESDCEMTWNDLDKNEMNGHNYYDKAIAKLSKSDYASVNQPGTLVLLKYVKTDSHINGDVEKNTCTVADKNQSAEPKKSILDLYKDPVFILICLINGLTNLNFGTLSTVIIDFGRDHNTYPEHDKYIMMCISVTGVIGMLGFGWVTDGGYMTRTRWASLTLVIGCACILVMPETSGFALLIVPLSIFCVCQSSFFPLIPAITAEYIREEFQEVAISACNVLSGPMYLIIPPLIGHFRDGKGSYDNIFYLMAGLSIVNSVSVFLIPYLASWRDKAKAS